MVAVPSVAAKYTTKAYTTAEAPADTPQPHPPEWTLPPNPIMHPTAHTDRTEPDFLAKRSYRCCHATTICNHVLVLTKLCRVAFPVIQSNLMAENPQHQLYPKPAAFPMWPDAEYRLGFLGRWVCQGCGAPKRSFVALLLLALYDRRKHMQRIRTTQSLHMVVVVRC